MIKFQNAFCVGLIGSLSFGAHAGSLEQFDYTAGALAGQNGGTGWGGAWSESASVASTTAVVAAPGLDSSNLDNEAGNTGFIDLSSGTNGARYIRTLDTVYSTGTVYLSLLMQNSDPTDASDPFAALELASGGDTSTVFAIGLLRSQVESVAGPDGYAVRIHETPGSSESESESLLSPGYSTDVNLFVVAFDLDTDTYDVFVNPNGSTDLAGAGEVSGSLTTGFTFDRVGLAGFIGSNNLSVDEIRIDTTAPALVPEPSSLALLGLGGLAMMRRRRA